MPIDVEYAMGVLFLILEAARPQEFLQFLDRYIVRCWFLPKPFFELVPDTNKNPLPFISPFAIAWYHLRYRIAIWSFNKNRKCIYALHAQNARNHISCIFYMHI